MVDNTYLLIPKLRIMLITEICPNLNILYKEFYFAKNVGFIPEINFIIITIKL